jgi:hypothetical protein
MGGGLGGFGSAVLFGSPSWLSTTVPAAAAATTGWR